MMGHGAGPRRQGRGRAGLARPSTSMLGAGAGCDAPTSVLAEVELLGGLAAERVAEELLVAGLAQVVAQLPVGGGHLLGGSILVGEDLADLFEAVGVEVLVGQLSGVVGGEDLHL